MVAILVLTVVGNIACRTLFRVTGIFKDDKPEDTENQRAGRVIGGLERSLIAAGLITQRWEVLAAVIALKSVSRFKRIDEQNFAECFLIGSLFSILWALAITSAWLAYDASMGSQIQMQIHDAVGSAKSSERDAVPNCRNIRVINNAYEKTTEKPIASYECRNSNDHPIEGK